MKKRSNRAITALLVAALALTPTKPARSQQAKPHTVLELCLAVVVVGTGAIIIYKLKKLCDSKLGPPPSGTNNPVPPPPPPPPPKTNHIAFSAGSAGTLPTLELSEDDITEWDISTNGYTDPQGQPYLALFAFGIGSSTNLASWQSEGTVTGWVSPNWIVTIGYTNGIPVNTNWTPFTIGCTNTVNLPLPASRSKFFRTDSQ